MNDMNGMKVIKILEKRDIRAVYLKRRGYCRNDGCDKGGLFLLPFYLNSLSNVRLERFFFQYT